MTQEDKQLLFQDLCARLPYHIKVKVWLKYGTTEEGFLDLEHNYADVLRDAFYYDEIKDIKPYLRPMSSMTEEEFVYFMGLRGRNLSRRDIRQMMKELFNIPNRLTIVLQLFNYLHKMDWLLSKHFDVRGLIPKGLAIEIKEENNPYKE